MEKKPALDSNLIQDFVRSAHADIDRVKELLAQESALINSAWDWGGGDWETALGSAAHMGRKDIANYLLEQGARIDLYSAAMLGKLAIVKTILETYPEFINIPGPHGIPLIVHAEAGGADAKDVLDFLKAFN